MATNKTTKPPIGNHLPKISKPKDAKKTLSRLMLYLNQSVPKLILVLVLTLLSSFATVASSYFIKPLIDNYIIPGDMLGLARMLSIIVLIYIVGALAGYVQGKIMLGISQNTVRTMRKDLFNKLQDLPLKYFDSHATGDTMSRFTNDLEIVGEALTTSLVSVFSNIVNFILIIVAMLVISPFLTFVAFLILPVMFFIAKKIVTKSAKYFASQQQRLGDLNGFVEEHIEGLKVVKVFNHEKIALEDFNKKAELLREASTKAQINSGVIMPLMMNLGNVNYAITATVGGLLSVFSGLSFGSLGAFLSYSRQFSRPMTEISNQVNNIQSALAGSERMFEIMDIPSEIDDGKVTLVKIVNRNGLITQLEDDQLGGSWHWKIPSNDDSPCKYIELRGDVRFENVTFGYNKDQSVLKDVSLYAKPGQKIAFVGSTGAGKTTITNLINRFYDVDYGAITYDSIDVRDIKKDDLRSSLGMVLQDTHLFTGTVMENIRYGNLEATDDMVIAASKLSSAHSFIKRLPQGYQTVLSSDGENLSQGQRQLLSIARAAVADPPVLILDEATSSIDTRTERLIEIGMDRLMENRTVFVIAHRLSTVRNSNAIIVLEQGEIIERGDHEDLLKQQGRYYKLYTGQFVLD